MTKIVIVNEADKPIGLKSYESLKYKDIYRVSSLWLTDKKTGDCLLTQRKWKKHNDPGKWMAAVSGTIEEGEEYDENIVHETDEEIGLKGVHFHIGPKEYVDDGKHRYFVQWYVAEVDKDRVSIRIQEEEVEDYTWMTTEHLLKEVQEQPEKFVPSMSHALELLDVR